MAGGTRSELASSSPEGSAFASSYLNGQRGSYTGPSMERSGSFRESLDCRVSSSGLGVTKSPNSAIVTDTRTSSSGLMLEPLSFGDQRQNRHGDLRRALGFAFDDHQTRFHQFKPSSSEELKNFKLTLHEIATKAKEKMRYYSEAGLKVDKYRSLAARKKSRSENTTFEKTVGMMAKINHNLSDPQTQRQEERAKNTLPNRRIRSSMSDVRDLRSEGRMNTLSRQNTIVERDKMNMDRDKNMLRTCNGAINLAEDKSRVLSTGGDGWNNNKNMKRKRSAGILANRTPDSERDVKQALPQRFKNEPRPRPSDSVGFRPGSSNGSIVASKSDGGSQPGFCTSRASTKNTVDNITLSNDRREHSSALEKERNLARGIKFAFREDSLVGSQGPLTKGKASRASRAGSVANSASIIRTTGCLDGWEQTPSSNKNQLSNIPNSRKRPLPTGPSSPHVAQWGGQRPHKIRMRRTSLISPVSGHDDSQNVVAGLPASDVGGSAFSKGISGVPYQSNMKFENVDSPTILSESEESGAAEKGNNNGDGGLNASSRKMITVALPVKKNKLPKEEAGDRFRRIGRSGRGLSQPKAGFSLMKEKSENNHTAKPMRNGRPCSDRSESKVGRPPSKKAGDRKSFTRPGQVIHSVSAEITGDCEDDYDELLVAAKNARKSLDQASSNVFWKKMTPFFEPVGSDSLELLKQQIAFAEELDDNFCIAEDKVLVSQEKKDKHAIDTELERLSKTMCSLDEDHQIDETFETDAWLRSVPLSQRLMAAFLPEFETDCKNDNQDSFSQFTTQISSASRCLGDSEGKDKEHLAEIQSEFEITFPNRNGCVALAPNNFRSPVTSNHYSDAKVHSDFIQNGMDRMQNVETDYYNNSPVSRYEQMPLEEKLLLELQSIGFHPETVPDLSDGEDEPIDKDISKLKMMLHQKVKGKFKGLVRLAKVVQSTKMREEKNMEKLALDQHVERAYKKILGGRGNHHGSGIKGGGNKVSKQIALDFGRRALARCRKFESSDQSCFSEAPFRNILFSPSQLNDNTKPNGIQAELNASDLCSHMMAGHGYDRSSVDSLQGLTHTPNQSIAKHEMVSSNRGKKREILLDDVGNAALCSIPGGAKGKRSERERDQNTSGRNSVSKIGRPLSGSSRGERKSRTKVKQKTAQLSASGVVLGRNTDADITTTSPLIHESCEARIHVSNTNSYKGNERASSSLQQSQTPSQEILKETEAQHNDLIDSIEVDLGVGDGLGEQDQDFGSWFNIDDDIMGDNDVVGLDIPMDDLAELDMNF